MFHPWIGLTALVGAIILVVLTLLTEVLTREPTRAATALCRASRNALAEASRRNAEVLTAMGMAGRIAARWSDANRKYMASQRRASDVAGGLRRDLEGAAHDAAVGACSRSAPSW